MEQRDVVEKMAVLRSVLESDLFACNGKLLRHVPACVGQYKQTCQLNELDVEVNPLHKAQDATAVEAVVADAVVRSCRLEGKK